MSEFINLTPHAINICDHDGKTLRVIEPSGSVARISVETTPVGIIDGIQITKNVYGDIVGLPKPKEGRYYIVSSLVAQQVPNRDDVLVTNDAVRDDKGRIIGCKSLARI